MGKNILLSPFLFIVLLGFFLIPVDLSERGELKDLYSGNAWAQANEREAQDSHYIQLMKQLRGKVDGWLKDLNQRIESEDITRFEVRFLEILRSLLEWVRDKIDVQIEGGGKKPKKKTKGEDL